MSVVKWMDPLFRGVENFLALVLSAMVLLVFGNVVLRYGFNSGLVMSEELSRFLLVWLVFIGAIAAMRDGAHLGSDTLLVRLSPRAQRLCAMASQVVILVCCVVLAVGCWQQHDLYAGTAAPVTGISMIWVYGVGYVCAGGIGAIAVSRILRIATGRATRVELGLSPVEEPL